MKSSRLVTMLLIISGLIIALGGCGGDGDNGNGPTPVVYTLSSSYFPMADGDTWYFDTNNVTIVRTISGDTVINGVTCKRVLENGVTSQAWVIQDSTFRIYLIAEILRPEPPLDIPFTLERGKVFSYGSTLYDDDDDSIGFASGSLEFRGKITDTVPAGIFDSVATIYYSPDDYTEYYAPGVGLLNDEFYLLDSALIGGVWYR